MEQNQNRFKFLDGLRALAAIYVTVHHASIHEPLKLTGLARYFSLVFKSGHYAVDLFIVI